MPAKPFLKWAGGKAKILDSVRLHYPGGLGGGISKYVEPFVGGGAVLFDVINNYCLSEIYISDTNCELINAYIAVRDNAAELVFKLKGLESEYLNADEAERKRLFYVYRERFNAQKKSGNGSIELAALFIYLNKTCFNGLYRVNSKGEYNVPQGRYKRPSICDESNLLAVSKKLKNAYIVCADYKESASFIDGNTFVYIDPPYRPLSASSNFTSYTFNGFGEREQVELARFIDEAADKGAYVLSSNSDPKNIDSGDDFFDELYKKHSITRIGAGRSINANGGGRGKICELLISNYEK